MELLVKEEFWNELYKSLDVAEKNVFMQFMTFEGDSTGLKLARKLLELKKKGIEIILLVDYFSNYWVSDAFFLYPKSWKEAITTRKMFNSLKSAGIKLFRTRNYGFLGPKLLFRNHKKIIIIDDTAYLGGINISDHNKEWFDFMIKIDNKKVVETIKKDFFSTMIGKSAIISENNVYTSEKLRELYYTLINNAKKEIVISSPYIMDFSLIQTLKVKAKVKLFTLENNNFKIINWMNSYLIGKLQELGVEIFYYKYFSHAKFLLVDDKYLLIGSSNFGEESFLTKDEIGFLIKDKDFIKLFRKRMVVDEELIKVSPSRTSIFGASIIYLAHKLLHFYSRHFQRGELIEK